MPLIHLIRHAKPAITGVLLGTSDVPLAETAISPSSLKVERVISSPLLRARRTAELLFPNQPMQVIGALAERHLGDWELRSWRDIESRWPELAATEWFEVVPPNGESWPAFESRVRSAWEAIPRVGDTAIVAHAGVNALLHHFVTGAPVASFQQQYLEIITLAIPD